MSGTLDESSGMDAQPQLVEGMKLGRFVLLQAMGRGGMGSVYAAWDPDLGRRVALKVLHPGSSSNGSKRARMLREARALAQLNHPNVVRVYELGETDEFPYLVMELVDGESLGDLVRNMPLPQIEVLRHFVSAADGLRAVHELGIVHRDIKPANIFVGEDGRVCIGDFGLAVPGERLHDDVARAQNLEDFWLEDELTIDRELSEISADEISLRMTLTRAGSLLGTPAFMAPEHLQGERVDERSDQFSFAISIWRALFGKDPFPSANSLVRRLERMADPPEPVEGTNDDCDVIPVLKKALSFDPERRYRDMASFQDELRRCLENAESPKHPPVTKFKSVFGVAAGLGLAVVLGSFSWFQISKGDLTDCNVEHRISSFRSSATQHSLRNALMRSSKFDEKRADALLAILDAYAARWHSAAEAVCQTPSIATPATLACLEARLGDLNAVTSLITSEVPEVLPELQAATLALAAPETCFREISNAHAAKVPGEAVKKARTEIAQARALYLSGVYGRAQEHAQRAKEIATSSGAKHELAESTLLSGQTLAGLGRFPEAAQTLRDAISTALTIRAERVEAAAWGQLLFVVGDRQGNFEEGLRILPMVRAAAARVSYDHRIVSATRLAEALLWKGLHNPQKAENAAREALAAADKRVPADPRQKARILCVLGLILSDLDRVDEGIDEIRKAREVATLALSDTHFHVAIIDNNLGTLLMRVENYDEARSAFARTLKTLQAGSTERRHIVAAPLNNLGKIERHLGNLKAAQSHFEHAHELLITSLGKDHRRTLIPQLAMARIAQDRGSFSEAARAFENVAGVLQHSPDGQVMLAQTRVEQAYLAMESGFPEKAKRHLEQVSAFVAQRSDVASVQARWALAEMTRFALLEDWTQAEKYRAMADAADHHKNDPAALESLQMARVLLRNKKQPDTLTQTAADACAAIRRYSPALRLLSKVCQR